MKLRFWREERARALGLSLKAPRPGDAGFDVPALESVTLQPGERVLVRTGLYLAIPEGWVGLLKDRSSVASKRGVHTLAGVIDSSYRGEVRVLLQNLSSEECNFESGERIAQLVVVEHLPGQVLEEVSTLDALGETERHSGGFGSTGS